MDAVLYYHLDDTDNAMDACDNDNDVPLPSPLLSMSYSIVDTGASTHLENGPAGFISRKATHATVSTGLSSRSPCDFSGAHEQYMLGTAPDYEVIRFRRPDVLCHSTFKRALFSVRAAWEESRIKARFEDDCMLILDDGKQIPFYKFNNTYVLPRWTNKADADATRALLTSPSRSAPRGSSTTHDDWISTALQREHATTYDAVHEFMRDHDELHATHHHTSNLTNPKVDAKIRLLHHRFGHLAPQAMKKLPRGRWESKSWGTTHVNKLRRPWGMRVTYVHSHVCSGVCTPEISNQKVFHH